MAGLLLAAGSIALESLATPVVTSDKAGSRDAMRGEGLLSDELSRPEKNLLHIDGWWSLPSGMVVGEIPVDSGAHGRRAGPTDAPYVPEGQSELPAQFDNPFGQGNTLYRELLRKRGANSPPDLGLGGMIDSVLRSAWDTVADESNTANISLAGIEMSLTLRGDQRSLMINGYDVLPAAWSGNQQPWQGPKPAAEDADVAYPVEMNSAPLFSALTAVGDGDGNVITRVVVAYEAIRGFATHPLTIFFTLTYMLAWISVRVMHALRERRGPHRHYRR